MRAYVLFVSGRVQGVGFRWYTVREASKRGIRGYVQNLSDGRVKILAQADSEPLADFLAWVGRGPSSARVDRVEREPMPVDETLSSFEVRY